jgi:hypothetical protein
MAFIVGAQVIVTCNLKHLPAVDLRPWDIEAKSPDNFVLDQVGIDGRTSMRQYGQSAWRRIT